MACFESTSSSSLEALPAEADSDPDLPDLKRSRKWSGAATYKTKFSDTWIAEFPFISSVSKDPYRYIL